MQERTSSLWIVALVAVAGLFRFAPVGSPPTQNRSTVGETKVTDLTTGLVGSGEEVTLRLLADHYMTPYGPPCEADRSASEIRAVTRITETTESQAKRTTKEGPPRKEPITDCVEKKTIETFRRTNGKVLIALLPDPIDAHATYKFDEAVESLQAGAQDADYLLDRFSLPWPRRFSGSPEVATDAERYRSQPGVMILRKPDTTEGAVVLLLVGETSTTGVHGAALVNAFKQWERLAGGPKSEIKVVGPTFSGSVGSIRASLRKWAEESTKSAPWPVVVHFVSGNATSLDARRRLESPLDMRSDVRPVTIRYHATVLPDNVIQCATMQYLKRTRVDLNRVAVLTESDSFYGIKLLKPKAPETSETSEQVEQRLQSECPEYANYRYHFPYPLLISQVRTRYQKELVTDRQAVNVAENPAHAALQLSTDDAENPSDKPQAYSPGPSANVAELALTAIFTALNREHITHVGLFGTDTRDKIFLARLIRSYFPNIQFFTDDSDILYTHPDFAADLWGMLVFSTNPLVSQNTTWIRDEDWLPNGSNVRQFSSQTGESLYNATHIALSDFPLTSEPRYLMLQDRVHRSDGPRFMLDYWAPLYSAEPLGLPVVWVTVVGNQALWPVSTYDPWVSQRASLHPPAIQESFNVQSTRTFMLSFILLSAFCLVSVGLHAWALNDRYTASTPPRYRIFERVSSDLDSESVRLCRVQAAVIFCYFTLLLTVYISMALIMAIAPPYWEFTFDHLLPKVSRVLAFFTVTALVHGVHQSARSFFRLENNWKTARLLMILDGVIVVIAVFVIRSLKPDSTPSAADIMLYERSVRFGSGVSPILPIFFLGLGVAIWLICFLKRTQVVRYGPEAPPFSGSLKAASGQSFFQIHQRIREAMRTPYRFSFDREKTFGLMAAVVVTLAATWWAGFFNSMETRALFYWLSWTFFVALVGGLFWSARDFWIISNHLRTLLRKLAFHRLAGAFDRLPPKYSRGLSTNLMDSPPVLVELQEPYDQLVNIRNKFKSVDTTGLTAAQISALPIRLDEAVLEIGDCLSAELEDATYRPRRRWALSSKTHQKLSGEAARLLEVLSGYWQGTTFSKFDPAVTPKTRAAITKAFALCEDFVAYQIVGYLNAVFLYLRYLLVCAFCALLFLLMAVSSYPFSVQNLMMNFSWLLVLVFSFSYIYALVQYDRNEVIRAIRIDDKTKTLGLKRTMFAQVALFGLIPALLFLASKFPSLGKLISSWIGPVVRSLSL